MLAFFSSHLVFSFFLLWIAFATLVCFAVFGIDKAKSIHSSQNRISEKTLLYLCVWGGSLGALLGIYLLRHKSLHFYFPLVAWQSLILQSLLLFLCFLYLP